MIQIFLRRNKIFTNIFSFPQHSQKHCLFYFRKKKSTPKIPWKNVQKYPQKKPTKKNIIDWEKRSKDQKIKRSKEAKNNRKYIEKIPSKSEQKEKNQNDEKYGKKYQQKS